MKKCLIILFAFFPFVAGNAQSSYPVIKLSDDVSLIKVSENAWVHVSWAEESDFGRYSSNGLIFTTHEEAFLFDTPVTELQTAALVSWIRDTLHLKLSGFVPNHWHSDCMGGLAYLKAQGIKSYANLRTINIAKAKKLPVPEVGFTDSLHLKLGDKDILCYYPGEAHSLDNIVVWIPSEEILFGGCMLKELRSQTLGNIVDANVVAWPQTIRNLRQRIPSAKIVIPGHGAFGSYELVDHTQSILAK